MARFVDLDDEDSQAQPMAAWPAPGNPLAQPEHGSAVNRAVGDGDGGVVFAARRFPSRKSTMTDKSPQQNGHDASEADNGKQTATHSAMEEAFQCYPYDQHSLDPLRLSTCIIERDLTRLLPT